MKVFAKNPNEALEKCEFHAGQIVKIKYISVTPTGAQVVGKGYQWDIELCVEPLKENEDKCQIQS